MLPNISRKVIAATGQKKFGPFALKNETSEEQGSTVNIVCCEIFSEVGISITIKDSFIIIIIIMITLNSN